LENALRNRVADGGLKVLAGRADLMSGQAQPSPTGVSLRVLSGAMHFALVTDGPVYGTAVPSACYPQMRAEAAAKGRVDAMHTHCSTVDKPVETVDSHMQLLLLP
jgi:hypothetical protein